MSSTKEKREKNGQLKGAFFLASHCNPYRMMREIAQDLPPADFTVGHSSKSVENNSQIDHLNGHDQQHRHHRYQINNERKYIYKKRENQKKIREDLYAIWHGIVRQRYSVYRSAYAPRLHMK